MALGKAERLTDEQLTQEIEDLRSGKRKLRLRDDQGRPFPLREVFIAVFERVLKDRKEKSNNSASQSSPTNSANG